MRAGVRAMFARARVCTRIRARARMCVRARVQGGPSDSSSTPSGSTALVTRQAGAGAGAVVNTDTRTEKGAGDREIARRGSAP